MNDPHVVALFYNIDHGNTVSYNEAEPLDVEEKAFRLEVKDRNSSFYLKDHYAGEAEARIYIEEYIRNWEFDACLHGGHDCFNLIYERAEIVDRKSYSISAGSRRSKIIASDIPTGILFSCCYQGRQKVPITSARCRRKCRRSIDV